MKTLGRKGIPTLTLHRQRVGSFRKGVAWGGDCFVSGSKSYDWQEWERRDKVGNVTEQFTALCLFLNLRLYNWSVIELGLEPQSPIFPSPPSVVPTEIND